MTIDPEVVVRFPSADTKFIRAPSRIPELNTVKNVISENLTKGNIAFAAAMTAA